MSPDPEDPMNPNAGTIRCEEARVALSARLDGELPDERPLVHHLAGCSACRGHERELAALARTFDALRAPETPPEPVSDLWPRIAARLRPAAGAPLLARLAAGLVGFAGLGAAAWWVEGGARSPSGHGRHLVERLAVPLDPHSLFAALPEYRVLRVFPVEETR
jgi:anti-sigma factor RsiW